MAYRQSDIGILALSNAAAARAALLIVFEEAGGDAEVAAERLEITRRTFDRLVARLDIAAKISKMRSRARKVRKS